MTRSVGALIALFLLIGDVGFGAAQPPLVLAAKSGDIAAVRALLKEAVNVNTADADGTTALHWGSYRDDLEAVDVLIRAGAQVNAANDLGVTPLWIASQNGGDAVVRRLLEAGANPNAKLLAGETPLMVAARSGYPTVVEQLIAKGAELNARAARGQTALMWAVAQKHPEVVKVLIAAGADIHAKSATWSQLMAVLPHALPQNNRQIPHGNDTALMFSARVGDVESAKLLVAAGANVNDTDAWGISATTLAAHSGNTAVGEFLLERGADANAAAAGFSALHVAIMRRDEKMVSALLTHGADPNVPLKTWTPARRSSNDHNFPPALVGASPYWLAARFTQPATMRLLAQHGADPRVVHHGEQVSGGISGNGYQRRVTVTTALLAALGVGGGEAWIPAEASQRENLTLETVKLALELGVDINAVNTDGRTALDAAKGLKNDAVVKLLVDHGAKSGTAEKQ